MPRSPRNAMSCARLGWAYPVSSVARLCSTAAPPSHCHAMRKRVTDLDSTGSCNAASPQLLPPSAETSTLAILPYPDQARPEISYRPAPRTVSPGDGWVMIDLPSSGNTNCNAFPDGSRIVYLDVSSLVMVGPAVSLMRRSHLTFMLPSKPGSSRRRG